MQSVEESLAAWATIVGTIVSIIGLIQSRAWLAAISALFVASAIVVGLYARRNRLRIKSATVTIEGRSIDSLNIATLGRRINRSLVIQEVHHIAKIDGDDLDIEWIYSGYCRAEQETAIEFSIDTDNNIPFDTLKCFAYDLRRDPFRKHKIRPLLIGADGVSKKIAIPFLEPLREQEPFNLLLKCKLQGCMKPGLDYYTSTLSFAQKGVRRCTVRLVFPSRRPAWVRVYECNGSGNAKLLKDLRPVHEGADSSEYLDFAENVAAQSARIYLFWREAWLPPGRYDSGEATSDQIADANTIAI